MPSARAARGGVVVCPPFGAEHAWAYPTFRLLAEGLEDAGFVVLRPDYQGTGESAGDLQGHWPPEALATSVRAGIDLVRQTGVDRLALVGMRLGATIAGRIASEQDVDALVLWDPVVSARSYLREQRALGTLTLLAAGGGGMDSGPPGGVPTPGFHYGPEGVADLDGLDLTAQSPRRGTPTLILHRPGIPQRERADLERTFDAEWRRADDQEELFADKFIPYRSIAAVQGWLDATVGRELVPVGDVALSDRLVVDGPTGSPVVERIERLGPLGLFGIVTEGTDPPDGPPVLLLDVAAEPPIGPGRLWVDLARRLAASGCRVVRFNMSGLGDSPVRPGQPREVVYSPEAIEDVVDVATALSPSDPSQVVLVGLCSGAYNALEAGILLSARGVCAINPIVDAPALDTSPPGVVRLAAQPRRRLLRKLSEAPSLDVLRRHLPVAAWWALDRVALVRSPAQGLRPLVERGTDTFIICGPEDGHRFSHRGKWILRRLIRSGRLRFEEVPGLDHSLMLRQPQLDVATLITEHILDHFGGPATATASGVRGP